MTDIPQDASRDNTRSSVSGAAHDVLQARDISGNIYFQYGPGVANAAPRQLPRGIRIFINRISDLAHLDEMLESPASGHQGDEPAIVYVISGTAGVGKTSLVLHWANRVRAQFPDGQLYVDLRGYDPGPPLVPDQILEQFLLALGIPAASIPGDLGAKSGIYRTILSGKRMLIILDNAATADQVRPLIPGVGRSLAIITSRSTLTSLVIRDGARRTTLDTLSEAESVNLITATTGNYRSGDDAAEILELATLCARLPLALRIAAERAASHPAMPLGELIADLRDRSGLWDTLSTDDEGEASAVRTVFAWSYRALPAEAARLFCFLGLHPGHNFSLHAAIALTGAPPRVVRKALGALEGACLLEAKGFKRYQFHDLLRVYAIDQAAHEIDREEQLAAVARVCEWYLHSAYNCVLLLAHDTSLLFELPPSSAPVAAFANRDQAGKWYTEERSNLVGAVRAAHETKLFRLTWQLGTVAERLFASYNHFGDWQATAELALAAARELQDRAGQAAMHDSLGRLARLLMQLDVAAAHYEQALAIYRTENDRLTTVKAVSGLAWVYLFAHRLEDSRAVLADVLPTVRQLGDEYWTANILFGLGYTYLQLLRFDEADALLTESLSILRRLNDPFYESMLLTFLSYLARALGDTTAAVVMAGEAVDMSRDLDNNLWEATCLLYLGKAQIAADDPGGALESYQRSHVLSRQESDISRGAWALDGVGVAYSRLGRLGDAVEFHRLAIAVFRQLGDRWKLAKSLARLADALPDNPEQALESRREAIEILADFPDPKSRAIRERLLAVTRNPA